MFLVQRLVFGAAIVLPAIIVGPAVLGAQKPKSETLYPVTAEYRCPLGQDCFAEDRIDRITGDLLGPYTGTTPVGSTTSNAGEESNHGPYFTATYALVQVYRAGSGRFFSLDFRDPLGAAPCSTKGTCRKNFTELTADESRPAGRVYPVDSNGKDLPSGFYSLAVGQSAPARAWINFPDPFGRDLLWTVRFAPQYYPGSSYVTITRATDNSWTVEATNSHTAMLESATTTGRTVKVHEGFYRMPFKMTVTRP